MNKKIIYVLSLLVVLLFGVFIGNSLRDKKDNDSPISEKILLPAKSVIDKAVITNVEFLNNDEKIIKTTIKYSAINGITDLLSQNIIDASFEAEVSGEVYLSNNSKAFSIAPKQKKCTLNLNDPQEIVLEFVVKNEVINNFPDNIQSVNVILNVVSLKGDTFVLSSSIVKE